MRMAAFLAILSTAITDFIFQPTYALEVGQTPLFLHKIATREPTLERYLRSVLLKAQPETERKLVAKERVNLASDDVMSYLEGIFPQEEQERLSSDVQRFCSRASDVWQNIQILDRMFIAVLDFDKLPPPHEWKIVDFGEQSSQEADSIREQQPDGTSSSRGARAKAAIADAVPAPERVVWPSLLIPGPIDEIAMIGYAISDSQVKAARAEKIRNPHRDDRRRQRARSMVEHASGGRLGAPLRRGSGRSRRDS